MISCLKKTLERENGVQISDKTPKNAENTTMRTLQSRQKKKTQANTQMTTPQPNDENASAANSSTSNNDLSFSCKETLYHRFTRADLFC